MLAVMSFAVKGGVGKSMVSGALALELASRGLKVGLLDADIDSPYLAEIFGAEGHVDVRQDQKRLLVPVEAHGVKVMSFALWLPYGEKTAEEKAGVEFTLKRNAATMDGTQIEQWIRDALAHTDWGDTEVLVIDAPAGSADAFLTIHQALGKGLLGIVAVALPNVTSALPRIFDACSFHGIRWVGTIENMAGPVFGEGKVEQFCKAHELPFSGAIPLDPRIREAHEARDPYLPEDLRRPIRVAADAIQVRMREVRR